MSKFECQRQGNGVFAFVQCRHSECLFRVQTTNTKAPWMGLFHWKEESKKKLQWIKEKYTYVYNVYTCLLGVQCRIHLSIVEKFSNVKKIPWRILLLCENYSSILTPTVLCKSTCANIFHPRVNTFYWKPFKQLSLFSEFVF